MKRKHKFMTAILSQEEWCMIKSAMVDFEMMLSSKVLSSTNKIERNYYSHLFQVAQHFNSISVPNIEDLADKIERERRKKSRDKPKQKAS